MPLYIEKINGDVNRPTNRQGEYRAICLFRKLENRKKAEICNNNDNNNDNDDGDHRKVDQTI